MSKIATIHDGLITSLAALLPNHQRIANPYDVANNPDTVLKQGFGLAVNDGENTERLVGCKISIDRRFTIVITRRHMAVQNDAETQADAAVALLEDLKAVANEAENNFGLSTSTVAIKYISDTGIEPVRDTQENYLMVSITLSAEYFEAIT